MQFRMWHLLAMKMRYTSKINQVYFVFRCDSQCIGVPRVPFYRMEYIMICRRGNTEKKCATKDIRSMGGNMEWKTDLTERRQ